MLAEEQRVAAVVLVDLAAGLEHDEHPVFEHLEVVHPGLGATDAAVAPRDGPSVDDGDVRRVEVQPAGQVGDGCRDLAAGRGRRGSRAASTPACPGRGVIGVATNDGGGVVIGSVVVAVVGGSSVSVPVVLTGGTVPAVPAVSSSPPHAARAATRGSTSRRLRMEIRRFAASGAVPRNRRNGCAGKVGAGTDGSPIFSASSTGADRRWLVRIAALVAPCAGPTSRSHSVPSWSRRYGPASTGPDPAVVPARGEDKLDDLEAAELTPATETLERSGDEKLRGVRHGRRAAPPTFWIWIRPSRGGSRTRNRLSSGAQAIFAWRRRSRVARKSSVVSHGASRPIEQGEVLGHLARPRRPRRTPARASRRTA